MNIQGIQNYKVYDTKMKPSKKKPVLAELQRGKRVEDTYEPAQPNDRKTLLASIKKKIQSGYYNSKEVVDDLSESFAKAFEKAL